MAENNPPVNQLDSNGNTINTGAFQWKMRASKEGGSNITIIGYAKPGSALTAPKWAIQQHTYDAAADIVATNFAEGSNRFEHVWDDSANITITAGTKADPCVLTAVNTLTDGDIVEITGVGGMTELNGNFYQVDDATGTTFSLNDLDGANIDSSSFGAYTSGGVANARNFSNYSFS